MNIWAWIALAYLALGTLITVSEIGKPRKVTTPGVAALALVFTGLFAWVIVLAATT
jgi:hypothetical protein